MAVSTCSFSLSKEMSCTNFWFSALSFSDMPKTTSPMTVTLSEINVLLTICWITPTPLSVIFGAMAFFFSLT